MVRVLIIGGGIAGLALARALSPRGVDATVVERSAEWPTAGTGVYLPGNATRALDALRLAGAVTGNGARISRQRFLDDQGHVLADVDVDAFWGGVGPCVGMTRDALHRALRDGLPDGMVRFGMTVNALDLDGGPVGVVFSDGSDGCYDLVVGADGLHSRVRRLVFGGPSPRPVGQVSWRFVVDGQEADHWAVYLGKGKTFLTLPVGRSRLYCYADVTATEPADPTAGRLDELRRLFAGFADPVDRVFAAVSDATEVFFTPIEEAEPAWVRAGVVLIGDAAHGMSPNMAQGVALAVEDALVLGETLTRGERVDQSLLEFEARRDPRVRSVQLETHRRDRVRQLPPRIRALALRHAGQRIYESGYRSVVPEP